MQFCAIAFVTGKAVLRIQFVVFQHETVARDFSNYGCGSDRKAFGIAPDNAADGTFSDQLHSTVHYHVIGLFREVGDSVMHGLDRGMIDVNLVYHLFIDYADADNTLF